MSATTQTQDLSNEMEVSYVEGGRVDTVHVREVYNDGSYHTHIFEVDMAEFVRDALAAIYNEHTDVEAVHHTEDARKVDQTVGLDGGVFMVTEVFNDGSKRNESFTQQEAKEILSGLRSELA